MSWGVDLSKFWPPSNRAVIAISLIVSIGSIVLFTFLQRPADAGRGGALAVAFSFICLFNNESGASIAVSMLTDSKSSIREQVRGILQKEYGPSERLAEVEDKVRDVLKAFDTAAEIDSTFIKRQNRALTIASVVGTLAWCFGDVIVTSLNPPIVIRDDITAVHVGKTVHELSPSQSPAAPL